MKLEVIMAGKIQAGEYGVSKPCPKCGGSPLLFAGDGSDDYLVICEVCKFTVHRNSARATISRWNVATKKAKSEDLTA